MCRKSSFALIKFGLFLLLIGCSHSGERDKLSRGNRQAITLAKRYNFDLSKANFVGVISFDELTWVLKLLDQQVEIERRIESINKIQSKEGNEIRVFTERHLIIFEIKTSGEIALTDVAIYAQ